MKHFITIAVLAGAALAAPLAQANLGGTPLPRATVGDPDRAYPNSQLPSPISYTVQPPALRFDPPQLRPLPPTDYWSLITDHFAEIALLLPFLALGTVQVNNLNNNEAAGRGFNRVFELTFDDLTETGVNTDQVLTLCALKPGDIVGPKIAFKLVTPFSDASDAAFNSTSAKLGDSDTADRFMLATQLNLNGTEIDFKAGTVDMRAYTAANALKLTVSAMAAKALHDLDAGELHVFVEICNVNDMQPAIS